MEGEEVQLIAYWEIVGVVVKDIAICVGDSLCVVEKHWSPRSDSVIFWMLYRKKAYRRVLCKKYCVISFSGYFDTMRSEKDRGCFLVFL